jgi:hypothetical protein
MRVLQPFTASRVPVTPLSARQGSTRCQLRHAGGQLADAPAPAHRSVRATAVVVCAKGSKQAAAAEEVEEYDPEVDALDRMEKSVESCSDTLAGIRTGAALLEVCM